MLLHFIIGEKKYLLFICLFVCRWVGGWVGEQKLLAGTIKVAQTKRIQQKKKKKNGFQIAQVE